MGFMIWLLGFNAIANAQNLNQLIDSAIEYNPYLKMLNSNYHAAVLETDLIQPLPDPSLSTGLPILRPETRLGAQVVTIGAKQMIPWFGTYKAKEDLAIAKSKPKAEAMASYQLQLVYELKMAYYQILFIQQEENILRKHLPIFDALDQVVLAKISNSTASAVDAIKIQLKVNSLRLKIASLEEEKKIHFAKIKELTGKDSYPNDYIADSLTHSAVLPYDLRNIESDINQHHPNIKIFNQQIDISNAELEINRIASKPKIEVGLDYTLIQSRTDADPAFNGRDILIPKVMVSLPLNKKKYRTKEEIEKQVQNGLDFNRQGLVNAYMAKIQMYKVAYDQALLNLETYVQQIKWLEQSYDILLTDYSVYGKRFDELMELRNEIIDYEVKINDSIKNTYWAVLGIEQYAGYQ
ncbi:hypothetical protein GCM10025777_55050 [Membranihabitans marinus]